MRGILYYRLYLTKMLIYVIILMYEGVASALRNKSTYWLYKPGLF